MSALDYIWPDACPECDARMGVLDNILLQMRRLLTLGSFFGGKGAGENRHLNKCDWCHQSNSAPKLRR